MMKSIFIATFLVAAFLIFSAESLENIGNKRAEVLSPAAVANNAVLENTGLLQKTAAFPAAQSANENNELFGVRGDPNSQQPAAIGGIPSSAADREKQVNPIRPRKQKSQQKKNRRAPQKGVGQENAGGEKNDNVGGGIFPAAPIGQLGGQIEANGGGGGGANGKESRRERRLRERKERRNAAKQQRQQLGGAGFGTIDGSNSNNNNNIGTLANGRQFAAVGNEERNGRGRRPQQQQQQQNGQQNGWQRLQELGTNNGPHNRQLGGGAPGRNVAIGGIHSLPPPQATKLGTNGAQQEEE